MAAIVSVAQMKAMEAEADRKGTSFDRMMDNAGKAVGEAAVRNFGALQGKRVILLCGGGNNGGDGLVAAIHMAKEGATVRVFLASERKKDDPRIRAAEEAGISMQEIVSERGRQVLSDSIREADLVVDAILGTGTRLPLRPPLPQILEIVRNCLEQSPSRPYVIAVDCPSGLDCDTGAVCPQMFPADLTVTLGAAKAGLLSFPGAELVGRLEVADIGLPADLDSLPASGPWLATRDIVRKWLKPRPRSAHKGTFGRVLIIGGSINYPGAPILAGQGAYRAGAGLVTLAVPPTVYSATVSMLPEATWIVLPEDLGVISSDAVEIVLAEATRYDSLVVGPGLGREKTTAGFLKGLLQEHLGTKSPIGFGQPEKAAMEKKPHWPPLIVDADALKILADMDGWPGKLPPGSVLTPHPGEMSILCGMSKEEIQKDRAGIAMRFAREWNLVVVLKGAFTVIASPDGAEAIAPFATSALARAGTGDVLAGVIGGLIAQGMKGFEAAVLGAVLHGRAGEIAAGKIRAVDSVLAGDVARSIADSIAELRQG